MPAVGSSRKRTAGSWTSADGELEAPLHPTRQPAGAPVAHRPQVHELEDLAGPPATPPPEEPEERRDEVDVFAGREVRIERELLRHVADPFACAPLEAERILAHHADLAIGRGQRSGHQPHERRLAGSGRTDDPDDRALRHRRTDTSSSATSSPKRFDTRSIVTAAPDWGLLSGAAYLLSLVLAPGRRSPIAIVPQSRYRDGTGPEYRRGSVSEGRPALRCEIAGMWRRPFARVVATSALVPSRHDGPTRGRARGRPSAAACATPPIPARVHPPQDGPGLHLPRQGGEDDPRPSGPRADPQDRHPTGVDRCLDLAVAEWPPPGHRPGRARSQAVSLSPALARAARGGELRADDRLREGAPEDPPARGAGPGKARTAPREGARRRRPVARAHPDPGRQR